MSNKSGPSIYIPSDKNIYDALQHKKVGQRATMHFLKKRGILVSSKLSKTELARRISKVTFDYHDFLELTKILENPNRKEKSTRVTVKTDANEEDLLSICNHVADTEKSDDESYRVIKKGDSVVLVVKYAEIDFTKTQLRQRNVKNCEINLSLNSSDVAISMPATNKAKDIVSKIKAQLEVIKGEKLTEETLSLENIVIPEARTLFFDQLIKSLPGYKLENVSSVNVHSEIDNLDEAAEDDEDQPTSAAYAGYINKAVLTGGSVLESAQFKQLHSSKFFISKIIWTAEDVVPEGDIVELEAMFGVPASCTDFQFLVRGVRAFNEKTGAHNKTKRSPSRSEMSHFDQEIDKASKLALEEVKKKYT